MSSMTEPFLNAQIDLYAVQSEVAESVSASPRSVDCRDLEDAIALGLTTFAGLRRHSQSWAAGAVAGKVCFSWETSRRFSEQYRRWKERTGALLKVVDRYQAQRHTLTGERELRDAFRDVSLMPLDPDRMRAAYESLQAGEGISHSEAMDELRRRMAAGRA
jgi:hypothetical protein